MFCITVYSIVYCSIVRYSIVLYNIVWYSAGFQSPRISNPGAFFHSWSRPVGDPLAEFKQYSKCLDFE